MKSIKIKLNNLRTNKRQTLLDIFEQLPLITQDYLPKRLEELKTKNYKPFKEHYAYYRHKHPIVKSYIINGHLRNLDSTIRSYISWCKKKHKLVAFPEYVVPTIHLKNDIYHFEYNKKSKKFNAWFRFMKISFPLSLCDYHLKALKDLDSLCDSKILKDKKGDLYLRLVFKTKPRKAKGNKTLGIDLGIAKPIVCSDGKVFGSGQYIRHRKIEFGKKRAKHQAHVDYITQKQSNWTNDFNHKLSRALVDYCLSHDVSVLGLEKLKGSHLANKRFRKYNWAFKDLLSKIIYKAQDAGLKVIGVDPKYTSQTCSACGLKEKSNRITQSLYECSCGFRANADINAARNIMNLSVHNGLT